MVIFYVDDIIITTKNDIMQTFEITNLGDAKIYLGVELIYDNCAIYFHQRRYIQKLLDKFGMTSCNSLLVSMNPK